MSADETTQSVYGEGPVSPDVATSPALSRRSKRRRTILIVIIVVLLASLCGIAALLMRLVQPSRGEVATGDEAGGIEWVRSIYGMGPLVDELFVKPLKVEVGDGGIIYVTDAQYDFVMQFSPSGDFIRTIGDDGLRTLYRVGPVAEGEQQLFLGQTASDIVRVYSDEGSQTSSFAFPSPNDIEFEGGRIAVASNPGFVVFDANGDFVYEVGGTRGQGEDQFDVIPGLAIGPDDTVYVLDAYNNRISAYDREGNRLWITRTGDPTNDVDISDMADVTGSETTAPAGLQLPADAVVDGANRLVVVDGLDFSISVFDTKDGSFIKKYGQYGSKDGQLLYPTSIDYDPERDWFVVADGGNRRVQILRIEGSSPGAGVLGAARRALAGPLRACLLPLLLLVLMAIAWFVRSRMRRRAAQREMAVVESVADVESV